MLDRAANAALMPLLQVCARGLVRAGVRADTVTLIGFGIGIAAAVAIAMQHYALSLALLLVSRLADGLDGAVARLTQPSDRGAFLDITLDFLFYASIPLAFALADPLHNALPAPVSIVFPGQQGVVATGGNAGLLTREAPAVPITASDPVAGRTPLGLHSGGNLV